MTAARVLLVWPGTDGAAAGNFGVPQLVALGSYLRARTSASVDIVDLVCERALGRPSWPRLLEGPEGRGYDVIAFGCYSSYDYLKCHALAEIARPLFPDAVLVAGGYHVSARPTDLVYDGSPFDVAIIGEAERPMQRVIESVSGGAPLRGEILGSDPLGDLEELPPSDWSLLDRYREIAPRVAGQAQVYLSRGCPFDCAFCMERAKREVSWRALSVERAVEEIVLLDRFLDLRRFTLYVADALFGMRRAWRRAFLEALARSPVRTEKIWLLIRVDMVEEEDLALFARANCGLGFGLESGDPAQLRLIRKAGRLCDYLDHMRFVADKAREHDVPWGANVIVGHPGETEETLRTSARYLSNLFLGSGGTTGFLSVDPFRLYPGSPIDDERGQWERAHGARFHRPEWWHDGDQEFLSEWVDPSDSLDYRRRVELTGELFSPILAEIPHRFRYQGSAQTYFRRAIDEQIEHGAAPTLLHYADRFYAWQRYLGREGRAREELRRDPVLAGAARTMRRAAVARAMRVAEVCRPDIEAALLAVPREQFVPLDEVAASVHDAPVVLTGPREATVSALHAYARSYALAGIGLGQRVLDLGAGTGYGAALLSHLVGDEGAVVAVELDPALAALARENLRDRSNVEVVVGDATSQLEPMRRASPFDAIVVGFSVDELCEEWLDLLSPRGTLVAPVGPPDVQTLVAARRRDGAVELERTVAVSFVRVRHDAPTPAPERAPAPEASTGARRRSLPMG